MNRKRYSFFHLLVQKIGSSRFGAWFYARTLHHFDRVAFKLSGGRATLTSALAGLPVVLLTTTGAKSGLPRTFPLLCIRDERSPSTFALVASNWGQTHYPAWYFNLKANPPWVRFAVRSRHTSLMKRAAKSMRDFGNMQRIPILATRSINSA